MANPSETKLPVFKEGRVVILHTALSTQLMYNQLQGFQPLS